MYDNLTGIHYYIFKIILCMFVMQYWKRGMKCENLNQNDPDGQQYGYSNQYGALFWFLLWKTARVRYALDKSPSAILWGFSAVCFVIRYTYNHTRLPKATIIKPSILYECLCWIYAIDMQCVIENIINKRVYSRRNN